jgi:hypothetical protein
MGYFKRIIFFVHLSISNKFRYLFIISGHDYSNKLKLYNHKLENYLSEISQKRSNQLEFSDTKEEMPSCIIKTILFPKQTQSLRFSSVHQKPSEFRVVGLIFSIQGFVHVSHWNPSYGSFGPSVQKQQIMCLFFSRNQNSFLFSHSHSQTEMTSQGRLTQGSHIIVQNHGPIIFYFFHHFFDEFFLCETLLHSSIPPDLKIGAQDIFFHHVNRQSRLE